jgi:putative ABC transport system substrate-binding protein
MLTFTPAELGPFGPGKDWLMVRRREFIVGLGGAAASSAFWPPAAPAQQRAIPTIGWLDNRPLESVPGEFGDWFRQGLAQIGFVEGRNVAIEYRSSPPQSGRFSPLAADLVSGNVAVIVAIGGNAAQAAKAATPTTPIVFVTVGNPVEFGLVASLNRPGGNLTGFTVLGAEIAGKRLDLLRKLVPAAHVVGMLGIGIQAEIRDAQSAADSLGLRLLLLSGQTDSEIAAAFETLIAEQAGALMISGNGPLIAKTEQLIALAARHAIPTLYFESAAVRAGGFASYGPDVSESFRQAGVYVGRILKGDKPADLPVVQQTRFEFAINLQTAKRLGLEVPPMVSVLADKIIE